MRSTLLLTALATTCTALAQPTVDPSCVPAIGESIGYIAAEYIELDGIGPDQLWDASELNITVGTTINHLEPADGQAIAAMPGTDVVQVEAGVEVYLDVAEDGLYVLGSYNPNLPITAVYDNPQKILEFPCTIGTSWTDIYTGSYTFGGNTFAQSGTSEYEAVGYGTLRLPWGDVENVLRIDVSDVYEETGNGNVFTYTSTSSFYYKPGVGFYVARSIDATSEFNGSTTGTNQNFYFRDELDAGVDERRGEAIGVEAFPVPAQHAVSLVRSVAGAHDLIVQDVSGRIVLQRAIAGQGPGLYKDELDITGWANGSYTVVIIDATGARGTTRLVVQR